MLKNNRPRYWVGWYDRWHLPLALLLVLLACLLGYLIALPVPPPTLQSAKPGTVQAGQALELTGTAPSSSVVRLWDGGRRLDETRADASGVFKFIVPNVAAGTHSFKAVVESNGNAVESAVLNLQANAPVVAVQPTLTSAPPTATNVPPTAKPLPPTAAPTKAPTPPTAVPPTSTTAPTAAHAAGTAQRRGKDNAEMVFVPAGEFTAGSDVTRTVYLDAYWLDRTEVTREQFKQFADTTGFKTEAEEQGWGYEYSADKWEQVPGLTWLTPRGPNSSIADQMKHPVGLVTWKDAVAYCTWAGKRLPTEAEWEKAARGTDGRAFPWGNTWDESKVNFCDTNCPYSWKQSSIDDGYSESAPIGSYAQGASPYGASDMAGNIWEWASDWFGPDYPMEAASRNPTGPASGETKVLRGGAWSIHQAYTSAASRFRVIPAFRERSVGLRCAQ